MVGNFKLGLFVFLIACSLPSPTVTVYFVDSQNGSDMASGLSEKSAWRSLEKVNGADLKPGDIVKFARGGLWRGSLQSKSGAAGAPVTYTCFGPEDLPKPRFYGSLPLSKPSDWEKMETNLWRTVQPVTEQKQGTLSDVGNLIFNGKSAGVKCWSKEQLKKNGCFWFDSATGYLWLFSAVNPAEKFSEIEAALRSDHVVDISEANHVVFSDLDVRYGAAHGFGGDNNSFITIRGCDISWIGGGVQFMQPDGNPVRFGNGIEFWENARNHLVEGCRIWEIYDAALTNQGAAKNEQRNITYRNNVIWNSEYSFEYWNNPKGSTSDNIVFTNNMCYNAGYGWGHPQRPDPNGRHIMFWDNTAKKTNVMVTHNVFAHATESLMWCEGTAWWKDGLTLDGNIWLQRSGAFLVEGASGYPKPQNSFIDTSSSTSAPTYDHVSIYQWQISASGGKQIDVNGKHADIQWSSPYAGELENLHTSAGSQDLVLIRNLLTQPQLPSIADTVCFHQSLETKQAITAGIQSAPQSNRETVSFLQYLGEATVVYWIWNEHGSKEISDRFAVQVYRILVEPRI
jgi:hypothetical protein